MTNSITLISFEHSQASAERLANALSINYTRISRHQFPDGESLVRLSLPLPRHLVIYCSLSDPNNRIIELILACDTARKKGVERITLVAPYLAYMRQDQENHPGEAVSQEIIGELLSRYIDDLITVDPHLHRVESLATNYKIDNAISLHATAPIGEYIAERYPGVTLMGPDSESEQWVSVAASIANCDYLIADKVRYGDRKVDITLPEADYQQRRILLVDDMISTGGTLITIAGLLKERGAIIEGCVVTHCLCSDDDESRIIAAGVPQILSTDSLEHHSARIPLAALLSNAIKDII